MLDISSLDTTTLSESGVPMRIRDPRVKRDYEETDDTRPFLTKEDGTPITITVFGPDTPRVARLLMPQRARFQTAALATQGRKGVKFSVEDMQREERENIDIAVAATSTWDGLSPACDAAAARTLYTTNADIREQVLAFVRDRGNFLPSASQP